MQRQHQKLQLFKPVTINDRSNQVTDNNCLSRLRGSEPFQRMSQQHSEEQEMPLGTDRLTSLHAKLHQEADKIRKWKTQTEMDMKQKDKKLNEATLTIESLRKSILELQLENENLSTKLQDEMVSKEEVFQRIQYTHELINLLKHQEEKLEEKLSKCEAERTELKYFEKEHACQFEEMCEKFKKLELDANEGREQLLRQVQEERVQRNTLEEKMNCKLSQTLSEVHSLKNEIQEKSLVLEETRIALQEKTDMTEATKRLLEETQQQVCQLSQDISSKQEKLEQLTAELQSIQAERDRLASELDEEREKLGQSKRQEDSVQEALNNSVAIFNQRQDSMQKEIELLKYELVEEQKRLREARAQLAESMSFAESIKGSRDVLLLEKKEMELCLEKLKTELTDLQSEKYKNKAEISSLEVEVESLQLHIEQERLEAAKAKGEVGEAKLKCASLEKENKTLGEETKKLKNDIAAQKMKLETVNASCADEKKRIQELQLSVEELTTQLHQKGLQMEQLKTQLKENEDKLSSKENLLANAESGLVNLQMELKNIIEERDAAKIQIMDLEKKAEAWRNESELAEGRHADIALQNDLLLKETEKRDQAQATEMQNHIEKNKQLQKQVKDLRAELKEQNKHVKDVEREMKSLQGRLTKQEKAEGDRKREVEYLKQELVCNEQAKEESENILVKLQEQLEQEKHALHKQAQQIEELKSQTAKAQKEKAEAVLQCDRQIIEMTATLEKYTQDHHKFLAQKDKEIEELRQKNNVLVTQKQNNPHGSGGHKETEEMKRKLATLNCELEQAQKHMKEKETEVETLKSQLTQQEQIVQEMKQNSMSLTPALHSTSAMDVDERRMGEIPCTPARTVNDAQHGILRQIDSVSKRRKVAFISPSVENIETFDVDTDSSTELEIEAEAVMNHTQRNQRTPLRLSHSPAGRGLLMPVHPSLANAAKSSKSLCKISTAHPRSARNLTPELSPKLKQLARTPNRRKTNMRTSKFFRSSPKERISIKQKEPGKERLSWFDEDVVYGFGSED